MHSQLRVHLLVKGIELTKGVGPMKDMITHEYYDKYKVMAVRDDMYLKKMPDTSATAYVGFMYDYEAFKVIQSENRIELPLLSKKGGLGIPEYEITPLFQYLIDNIEPSLREQLRRYNHQRLPAQTDFQQRQQVKRSVDPIPQSHNEPAILDKPSSRLRDSSPRHNYERRENRRSYHEERVRSRSRSKRRSSRRSESNRRPRHESEYGGPYSRGRKDDRSGPSISYSNSRSYSRDSRKPREHISQYRHSPNRKYSEEYHETHRSAEGRHHLPYDRPYDYRSPRHRSRSPKYQSRIGDYSGSDGYPCYIFGIPFDARHEDIIHEFSKKNWSFSKNIEFSKNGKSIKMYHLIEDEKGIKCDYAKINMGNKDSAERLAVEGIEVFSHPLLVIQARENV